jgi:hypothetical protein
MSLMGGQLKSLHIRRRYDTYIHFTIVYRILSPRRLSTRKELLPLHSTSKISH